MSSRPSQRDGPRFVQYFGPILVALKALGGSARPTEVTDRVVESSAPDAATSDEAARVFDAMGTALGGLLRARFRFTVFRQPGGPVMARAQERLDALSFLLPSRETLANEHRHTLRDLNLSFRASGDAAGERPG